VIIQFMNIIESNIKPCGLLMIYILYLDKCQIGGGSV